MFTMDPGGWDEIDEMIMTRRVPAGSAGDRAAHGVSLPRAVELFSDCYRLLRERRPHDLAVGSDAYGQRVYT
jgi:hypothetical protein